MKNRTQNLSQRYPPPRNFTPAGGASNVRLELVAPGFIRYKKPTGVRAAGIRYEGKVQKHLMHVFPHKYVPGPWFTFKSDQVEKRKWCQPDGLIIDIRLGLITIVEIKLRHTCDAWWQTRRLYEPVVQAFFGTTNWLYNVLEVVRWYDPDTRFPERYRLVPEPDGLQADKFGIHIWKP